MKRFIFFLPVILIFLLQSSISNAGGGAKPPAQLKVGDKAPDFTAKTISGETIKMSKYKNKMPVIVDIWATWCPPCQKEMPELQKLYTEYQGQFELIACSVDNAQSAGKVKDFVKQNKITFKIIHDLKHDIAIKYYSDSIPYLVVVGKDGKVLKTFTGYDPEIGKKLATLMGLKKGKSAEDVITNAYKLYDEQNELDKALKEFQSAIDIDPTDSRAFCGRGEIYLDKKNYKQAKADLSKAIELDASNVRAWSNMGLIDERQRKYDAALKIYKEGLSTNPGNKTMQYLVEKIETKLKVINTPAPDFTITTLKGETFKLSDYKGKKAVIVDLWATWCGPCQMELPKLQEFYLKHSDKVEIIAISGEKEDTKIPETVEKHKLTFNIAYDKERTSYSLFPTKGIPFLTIIDINGNIIDTMTGFHPGVIEDLEELLNL